MYPHPCGEPFHFLVFWPEKLPLTEEFSFRQKRYFFRVVISYHRLFLAEEGN